MLVVGCNLMSNFGSTPLQPRCSKVRGGPQEGCTGTRTGALTEVKRWEIQFHYTVIQYISRFNCQQKK